MSAPTVVAGGRVYVVDEAGSLRAFDAADGAPLWTRSLSVARPGDRRVAATADRAYVVADRSLRAFDSEGTDLWRHSLSGDPAGAPAVVDGVAFVADADGRVLAVDADGRRRWRADLDEPLGTGPVVVDGRVYVAGYHLFCLEPPA